MNISCRMLLVCAVGIIGLDAPLTCLGGAPAAEFDVTIAEQGVEAIEVTAGHLGGCVAGRGGAAVKPVGAGLLEGVEKVPSVVGKFVV